MTKPKLPPIVTPPPPVSSTGREKEMAALEERRRAGKRYNFADTILAPTQGSGIKTTLG